MLVTDDPDASRNGVYRLRAPAFPGIGMVAMSSDGITWVKEWSGPQTIQTDPHLPIWRKNDES